MICWRKGLDTVLGMSTADPKNPSDQICFEMAIKCFSVIMSYGPEYLSPKFIKGIFLLRIHCNIYISSSEY